MTENEKEAVEKILSTVYRVEIPEAISRYQISQKVILYFDEDLRIAWTSTFSPDRIRAMGERMIIRETILEFIDHALKMLSVFLDAGLLGGDNESNREREGIIDAGRGESQE